MLRTVFTGCMFLSVVLSQAQECYGTYGPEITVTDFGFDYPGKALPPGKTNYQFVSGSCPSEGQYTIIDSVAPCFDNSWLQQSAIPVNGNMMLVNAAITPGDVYVDTAYNLCGNTIYSFGAYVQNVSLPASCGGRPLKPRFRFSIETTLGNVLGSYQGGNLDEGIPTGYSVYFRNPEGNTKVVIRITDLAPGGCGNDFFLDNIGLFACQPIIEMSIYNELGAYKDICVGSPSYANILAKLSGGYTHPSYQWQQYNGSAWVDISGATTTGYVHTDNSKPDAFRYRLAVAEGDNIRIDHCRVYSDSAVVNVHDSHIQSTVSSNSPICENGTLQLHATGGVSYQWNGPLSFHSEEANPELVVKREAGGFYTVAIGDGSGCARTDTAVVNLIPAPDVTVSQVPAICTGNSVSLSASGGDSYVWQPASSLSDAHSPSPVAHPASTTAYTVTATNSNLCTNTAAVLVLVRDKPVVNAGRDKGTFKGQPVTLEGSLTDTADVSISWQPSSGITDIHSLTPNANPEASTNYILTAASDIGCGSASDTVAVTVYNTLSVPSAFTPNSDGLNDTWKIPALWDFTDAVVSVYNRFGTKIFSDKTAHTKGWNGMYRSLPQPVGTYIYLIYLGNNYPVIKGTFTLIR